MTNKKQKLARLNSLIQQVDPDAKPRNVSKVYSIQFTLSRPWAELLVAAHNKGLIKIHNPEYATMEALAKADATDILWDSAYSIEESADVAIIKGQDAVELLTSMARVLAPAPEDVAILWDDNDFHVVTLLDSTAGELDYYIDKMEQHLEAEQHEEQSTSSAAQRLLQQAKVSELADWLGHDRAIELLSSAIEDQRNKEPTK